MKEELKKLIEEIETVDDLIDLVEEVWAQGVFVADEPRTWPKEAQLHYCIAMNDLQNGLYHIKLAKELK